MISVILLNYNSSRFTLDCVNSIIQKTQSIDYEIVVVDNNSAPGDFAFLKPLAQFPNLTLVRSRLNLGFAGGNMLGVQHANSHADFYYFLNNDTLLRTNVLAQLSDFLNQNPGVGLCGAQMFDGDGKRQQSFFYLPTVTSKLLGHGVARLFRLSAYPSTKQQYTTPVQVPVIAGSTLFCRAAAFNAVGGFDTAHFLYYEEESLSKQLALAGWSAWFVPAAEFTHFTGQSTRRNFDVEKEYYISIFHYFRRFHSWPERALFRLYYTIKNGKKLFRDPIFGRLAWFILRGSPMKESLRYRQLCRTGNPAGGPKANVR
jgi:GT2 family glycosyltransferase